MEFFYNLFIFPVTQLIDLIFLFIFRVTNNYGLSIIGLSILMSVITLPLYLKAESFQQKERDVQKSLKKGILRIKETFSGDEQYMLLSAFYRQNAYHPVFAMRSVFGLLIQIPFFIAAYSFLSNLEVLKDSSFSFINNLGLPDGIFSINHVKINVLPIIMTIINILSGIIYSKNLSFRDKSQVFLTALIFLILLYNSPSGIVIYWTMNNIFSLGKNVFLSIKNSSKYIYLLVFFLVLCLDSYLLFFHSGYYVKRIFIAILFSSLVFYPVILKKISRISNKFLGNSLTIPYCNRIFISSSICIFILIGIVIPSSLISSSTQEFLNIETHSSPFYFLYTVALQSFGLFFVWPIALYLLFQGKTRKFFSFLALLFLVIFLVNNYLFPGNYGFITTTLVLSNPGTFFTNVPFVVINIICLVAIIFIFSFIFFSRFKNNLLPFTLIVLSSFIFSSIYHCHKIYKEYLNFYGNTEASGFNNQFEPVFKFSKDGNNVLIVMLDRAISAFIPYIFKEKPEILDKFSGFTYYPNAVSFGKYTLFGVPALYGGYEYSPEEIQRNTNKTLLEKYNESLLVLPRIFLENDYHVTVLDPPWSNFSWKPDLGIFTSIKNDNLYVDNLSGKYASFWLQEHPEARIVSVAKILKTNLIRFSFFKVSPAIIRTFVFDRGKWLSSSALADDIDVDNKLTISTINDYSVLDYLPMITGFLDSGDTFTIFNNLLTHEPAFFQYPLYTPINNPTNIGNEPFSKFSEYHANMAAFLLLGKWFDLLKENNVYDNTRIILVSDHGWNFDAEISSNVKLPNNDNLLSYNVLLMVKDFASKENLTINNSFMMNADVPYISIKNLIDNPINPYTLKPLNGNKPDKIFITSSDKLHPTYHFKYTFNILNNEWLSVKENVFDPNNWSE